MHDDCCASEFVDGRWTDCGCRDCREREADAIELDVETGTITWAEARRQHELNGTAE